VIVRPGVEKLNEVIGETACDSRPVFFEAPTGYGKTRAGPIIYSTSKGTDCVTRLIHTLPLRAIVEEAYRHYCRSLGNKVSVGYQAHGLGLAGKSPFYAADIIVSTMDSLAFNLFRSSVGESGLGHYEVPRAHLLTSTVILDEAHLPLSDPSGPASAMAAIVATLSKLRVPFVVETATLPPSYANILLEQLIPYDSNISPMWVTIAPRGGWYRDHPISRGKKVGSVNLIVVEDPDYYDWVLSVKWQYQHLRNLENAVYQATNLASSGQTVFFATSTVKDAVKATKLMHEILDNKVVLIHGRLTLADRKNALQQLNSKVKIIIGTSAVEAGVDLDSDVVITDVPVLRDIIWESIIQRLGRACRNPSRSCDVVNVYFYGPKSEDAHRTFTNGGPLNPRLAYKYKNYDGYVNRLLMDKRAPRINMDRFNKLVELGYMLPTYDRIEAVHESLCTPFRSDLLVPMIVPPEGWTFADGVEPLLESIEKGQIVISSLSQIKKRADEWLARSENGIAVLVARSTWSRRGHPNNIEYKIISIEKEVLTCQSLLVKRVEAFILKKDVYKPGLGLE